MFSLCVEMSTVLNLFYVLGKQVSDPAHMTNVPSASEITTEDWTCIRDVSSTHIKPDAERTF